MFLLFKQFVYIISFSIIDMKERAIVNWVLHLDFLFILTCIFLWSAHKEIYMFQSIKRIVTLTPEDENSLFTTQNFKRIKGMLPRASMIDILTPTFPLFYFISISVVNGCWSISRHVVWEHFCSYKTTLCHSRTS